MARQIQGRLQGSRVSVLIPCWNDGDLLSQAIGSAQGDPGVEVMVIDDGSTDPHTRAILDCLKDFGVRVVCQKSNQGVSAARNRGLAEASGRYVFPLDADDLAIPGAIPAMADRLDAHGDAGVCYGDCITFGTRKLVRAAPPVIDPFRLAYTNEYPMSALFRRDVLEHLGGWRPATTEIDSRQDWNLWMSIAEEGIPGAYFGVGAAVLAYRMHSPGRLAQRGRRYHRQIYAGLVEQHPGLFSQLAQNRRRSQLSKSRKVLYPIVYGGRPRWTIEQRVKALLDRFGLWTMASALSDEQEQSLERAQRAGQLFEESIYASLAGRPASSDRTPGV